MKRVKVLWLAVAVVGCAHVETPAVERQPASVVAYYPLAVGNKWTYQVNLLGERQIQTVEIVRQQRGFFEDNQGGELAVDSYGIRDHKRYLLRSPLDLGATWTNVVSVSSVEHYKLESVGEPCAAPAGGFTSCVRVTSRNRVNATTTLVAEFTFAPHVGIVRVRTSRESAGKEIPQVELALLKYELQTSSPPALGPMPAQR
jgi:hypothetical protein